MTNRVGLFLVLILSPAAAVAQTPQACEGLRSLSLANTTITTSAVVTGSFTPPGSANPNATISNLPSFCRVAATLKPTPDSEIIAEHLTKGVVDRRRPLCPHPQVAVYSGTGSVGEAQNFTCKAP